MTLPRSVTLGFWVIVLIAATTRIVVIPRQSLWVDEIFSLAMATGHSLEQPVAESRPSLGDYVESPEPQLPEAYRAYLSNGPFVSFRSVTRALLLSDASPPLYYVLLHAWTLQLGTSDFSLRLFSVVCSLACLPIIFLIGSRVGDVSTGVIASLLFALAPDALFYSTEGRMYSLVWLLISAYAYLILWLGDGPVRWDCVALAILVGAAGLLTHYFFLFPWLGCTLWLATVGPRTNRYQIAPAILLATAVLVSPWYVKVPASLRAWRITNGWLNFPGGRWLHAIRLLKPFDLAWSFVSLSGPWEGSMSFGMWLPDLLLLALVVAVAGVAWSKLRESFFTGQRGLLWIWLAASCLGPLCFDLLRNTYTSRIPRYALAGLPAALLLLAIALGCLPQRRRNALVTVILLFWAFGDLQLFVNQSRNHEPFARLAHRIDAEVPAPDIVVVHSIPSGILGLARYLQTSPPLFTWVGQLRQRTVPADIARVVDGHRKAIFVKVHEVREAAPEEGWLRAHAVRAHSEKLEGATLEIFEFGRADHRIPVDEAPAR